MGRSLTSRIGRNLTRWISIPALRHLKRRVGTLEILVEHLLVDAEYSPEPTKAFNGQSGRQAIFAAITGKIEFESIVETGTYLGSTTGWMRHVTALPVYTCEINRHFHLMARRRLSKVEGINFECETSEDFLSQLADSPLREKKVFFYLDAHWYESLPLFEELKIISMNWQNFVVMVDDFEVPGDKGYGYDDYGFRRALNLRCFRKSFEELGLRAYSPVLASVEETGARSGCIVLAAAGSSSEEALREIPLLRTSIS